MFRRARTVLIAATSLAMVAGVTAVGRAPEAAAAPAPPTDYCHGQCYDILPPGENGNDTLADILGNKLFGTRPPHTIDQLAPYADLADSYENLTDADLGKFFNDASFGVPKDQVEKKYQPRNDVTITRDQHDIPHIKGTTRSGTEFGAGYAAAQDRLWMMDVFRHVGRGELTGFAGGAEANRSLEQSFWAAAPYTEADRKAQVERIASSGPRGKQAKSDIVNFIAGINSYITKAHDGRYFPGEYDVTGHMNPITNAGKIEPFTPTDLVAIAGVIGALFGSGGGGELRSALVKQAAVEKYGAEKGEAVWRAFREENDPEAVLTVHDGQKFPYAASPENPKGVAMPDSGSVSKQPIVFDAKGSAKASQDASEQEKKQKSTSLAPKKLKSLAGTFDDGVLPGNLLSDKHGMSNALVVSGKHTDDGHPIAVFGPQTGYFAPQLLMLEELQGPGISSRGAAFSGLNMYVELGRGQDYAWSATSASQDVTDTYAVTLCNTDGTRPTKQSMAYEYHGKCLPMTPLEADDSWSPTIADGTPDGSYKLITYRTRYGLVRSRATIDDKPVAYTSLRDSYMHEADSIIGFQELNDPGYVHSPQTFQHAVSDINYTFNWFYADADHTAYYNSGFNPVRAQGVDPNLPVKAEPQFEWRGWNPDTNVADYTPYAAHPNSIDQDYYISWNNKQARGYTASSFGDGSVHRANLLDDRVNALVHSGKKVTSAALTKAMEDAAVTDLRGEDLLPEMLQVITSGPVTDPDLAKVVDGLRGWLSDGARRRETEPDSHTYAHADVITTFDAWWPKLVKAEFRPDMGRKLYGAMTKALQLNDSPSGGQMGSSSASGATGAIPHRGSAFQFGWWSYMDKDLRAVLGKDVSGGLGEPFCGGGDLAQCRKVLLDTLKQAAATPADQVYPGDENCDAGDQWCADSIIQRPLGGITDPKIGWQNRPTYQQVVQFVSHR